MMHGFSREELLCLAWQKPIMAQVEVTGNCNQRCLFCFNRCCPARTFPDLSLAQWQAIIRKLKRLGVWRLDFTGGEPLMYETLPELLIWAKAEGFSLTVNTNGTRSLAEVLPHLDQLIISVHGLADAHDQIVGREGSFALMEQSVAQAADSQVKLVLNMFLIKRNFQQLLAVWEYFSARYRIDQFAPAFAIRSLFGTRYRDQALVPTPELLASYVAELRKIPADRLGLKHGFHSMFIDDSKHYERKLALPNCAAGKYKLVVASDGVVYPCNFFRGPEYECGNLLTDDEQAVWQNGAGFQPFRQLVLAERIPARCQSCLKKDRCFSGCRAWSETYQEGGFDYACDSRCEPGSAYIGS